ncbi:MAG: MBL fold metallo-hydrolase [Archangiaceae bacterium]|nr:MBL fold metallo-hydrolase [Archangiaceae bacterium]
MPKLAPSSVTLFTYQVGFGDCFLLRFSYPDRDRHVLIDFGSTAAGLTGADPMTRIAKDIEQKVRATKGGTLDAIVVTHRHQDHISGFGAKKPWAVLAGLKPALVVQPWTEHPRAAVNATTGVKGQALREGHLATLDAMQALSADALVELKRRKGGLDEEAGEARPFAMRTTDTLRFIGEDNLKNASAVKNLMSIAKREYLSFGQPTSLERVLPGVKVHVLGPPTVDEAETITSYAKQSQEYWSFAAGAARHAASGKRLFPRAKTRPLKDAELELHWFMKRLDAARGEQLLQLVRHLDDVMNNTSLILLFEACGKKLLFPGDAQVENWAYALSKPKVRALLEGVDLYKVGHHGSLNATPRTLWGLFSKKKKKGLVTVLSTKTGKHGHAQSGTEVPRKTLLETLKKESELVSTQRFEGVTGIKGVAGEKKVS